MAGRLEVVELPALLQTLAVNRSTGRLNLTRDASRAVVVFRAGRILYAAASSARESFGSVLLLRGLITEGDLRLALERQNAALEPERLGRVLVEMGKIDESALREVMELQTREALQDLAEWKTGAYEFELLAISPEGEVETVSRLPRQRAMEDDMPPAACLTPPRGMPKISLSAIASRAPSHPMMAEVAVQLMRDAAHTMKRGVLFLVRPDEVRGMDQFGLDLPRRFAVNVVRDTAIPLNGPSVFQAVVAKGQPYRGPLAPTAWNHHLVERLGGAKPMEVVVLPMVVSGAVKSIFYGDNLPELREAGPLDALQRAVGQAARAMEQEI